METKLRVYMRWPIDYWGGWLTEEEFRANIQRHAEPEDAEATWRSYLEMLGLAKDLARRIHWEGDIAQGPYISVLPGADSDAEIMIAWKQSNNGTTYIATPYALPWAAAWTGEYADSAAMEGLA